MTYKSGGDETQVNNMLVRVSDGKMFVKNCKVIPGEEFLTQHRLMCRGIVVRRAKMRKRKKDVRNTKQRERRRT